MSYEIKKVLSREEYNEISIEGKVIGRVTYKENSGWHVVMPIMSENKLHLRSAQGFGNTIDDAIENTIKENIKEANEYIIQLEKIKHKL